MGKISVGILDGNLKSLGAFDQCQSIKSFGDNSEQKSQSPINGKYCTIQIPLNSLVGSLSEAADAADAVVCISHLCRYVSQLIELVMKW